MKKIILRDEEYEILQKVLRAVPPGAAPPHPPRLGRCGYALLPVPSDQGSAEELPLPQDG